MKQATANLHVRVPVRLMRRVKARALVDGKTQEQIVIAALEAGIKPVAAAELR